MGTTKISECLFNKNDKVTKQYAEPIVEKNLYTILGLNSREYSGSQVNKLLKNGEKQLHKRLNFS